MAEQYTMPASIDAGIVVSGSLKMDVAPILHPSVWRLLSDSRNSSSNTKASIVLVGQVTAPPFSVSNDTALSSQG